METITYGIIGAGQHALRSHALPAQQLGNMELAAVCDTSAEAIDSFSKQYDGETSEFAGYTDRDLFLQSEIGAVLIATPDEYHFDGARAALDAGKHVFVEKPVAVTIEDTEELYDVLQEADQAGLVVSSCHPRRFDPPFMWLKQQMPALTEEFGDPVAFSFDFSYAKPARAWKHGRGLLLDHANHEIDLVNYYFEPRSFEAHRLSDSYDHYQIAGVRDDGIAFGFTGTRRLNAPEYREEVAVRFERGEVHVNAHTGLATVTDHADSSVREEHVGATDYVQRGLATMANFTDAITGTEQPYLTPEDLYVNTATSVMLTNHKSWRYEHEY